tara:strand:- start:6528 stop:7868 length:1341 start_codon:yes stop_codon:yes gene_type:complete
MKNLLFYFKIKIIKILIPYLVKYNALHLISLLFILSLSKIKSILPKKKINLRVVVLSKSGGMNDIIESQKRFNENYLFLACPRIFFITIFRTIFDQQEYNNAEKFFSKKRKVKREEYKRFLVKFLEILNTKYKINAFIGFNFEFKQEIELAFACKKLKIPFLLLSKESVLTGVEESYLRYAIKKLNQKFYGHKIAVYSNYAKKIFTETNFANKKDVEVVGCSRLSESFSFKKKVPKKQILYYAIEHNRGLPDPLIVNYGNKFFKNLKDHKKFDPDYNWNLLHIKTLNVLKKFAINNPEISIIIKIKTGQSRNTGEYLNLPSNIKLKYFGPGHQLLEESKVVISWNSTATLEGIAANRFILIPYFYNKNHSLKKKNELILKLKEENYGYSESDFYKKLGFFMKKKYKKNEIYNNLYSLKYHLGNDDNKASIRLNKFLNKNISFKNIR